MLRMLERFRNTPIPDHSGIREKKTGFREDPIDVIDARYDEPLEDARDHGIAGVNYYHKTRNNPPYNGRVRYSIPQLYVRQSLIAPIRQMNEILAAEDLEFFLHDAWRPQRLQTHMHDEHYACVLMRNDPQLTLAEALRTADEVWARGVGCEDAVDPKSPPPHSTGAVIDASVRRIGGKLLWMGTGFDDSTKRAHVDYLESHSDVRRHATALRNRRLFYWVAREVQFSVNPSEYWHVSMGDQMDARLKSLETGRAVIAHYANARPPAGPY